MVSIILYRDTLRTNILLSMLWYCFAGNELILEVITLLYPLHPFTHGVTWLVLFVVVAGPPVIIIIVSERRGVMITWILTGLPLTT